MWNTPSEERLRQIPRLYTTEHVPLKEKAIHLHFFFGDCDWYVAEYDGEELFFGYAVLNNDLINSEWGYFTLSELKDINIYGFEVECDTHWKPTPAGAIERIRGHI